MRLRRCSMLVCWHSLMYLVHLWMFHCCCSIEFSRLEAPLLRVIWTEFMLKTSFWYGYGPQRTGTARTLPRRIRNSLKTSQDRRDIELVHLSLISISEMTLQSQTDINLVRNPVERVISHYFYMRNSKLRSKERLLEFRARGHWNESLRDCVMHQHFECRDNVMTRFFCGPHEMCKTGSPQAFQRAKYNIRKHYAAVGTTERSADFLEILKVRLPRFFHDSGSLRKVRVNANRHYMDVVDESTRQLILSRNQADTALYAFVKENMRRQTQLCKQVDTSVIT